MQSHVRVFMGGVGLTKKAEPPPTRGVNRDSGTDSANGGWLRRLVRPIRRHLKYSQKHMIITQHSAKIGKHAATRLHQSKADSRSWCRRRAKSNAATSTLHTIGIRQTINNQNKDACDTPSFDCRFSTDATQSPTNQNETKNMSAPERAATGTCLNLSALISA